MCGIFALLNYKKDSINNISVEEEFEKGQSRGPEISKLEYYFNDTIVFGFHRLAINGLNSNSNQPIKFNNIILICNGEIYNYKELYKTMNVDPITQSDCEVIIHLYLKYGIEHTLQMLDGVFAFLLFNTETGEIYVARDPFGVRPLYIMELSYVNSTQYLYGFASELKCLERFYNTNPRYSNIKQFEPGTFSIFNYCEPSSVNNKYFIPSFSYTFSNHNFKTPTNKKVIDRIYNNIVYYLWNAVEKRCKATDREVVCLLSGGLDSSLIAALVAKHFREKGEKIKTYSIGLADSEDIKNARIVADYIESDHHEVIITEDEMFNAIPEVISVIESYDTTTVRASIGNYLIGQYIEANSYAKVVFNGDGSDELFGGYLYMNRCPDDIEFDKETRRLLKDIHTFDVLRSDKSISSNGLEPRTPFLDRSLVNYVLSIPPYIRNHNNFKEPEKYLIRHAFNNNFFDSFGKRILPDEILWRKKEAFSDGVSTKGRSLYTILQEKIRDYYNKIENTDKYEANIEIEKKYYKELFDFNYPNCSNIIPYFWMPRYTNAVDPSARTLALYDDMNTPDVNKECIIS